MQKSNSPYFGGIVGRVANRVANATFILDGKNYHLDANDRCSLLMLKQTPRRGAWRAPSEFCPVKKRWSLKEVI